MNTTAPVKVPILDLRSQYEQIAGEIDAAVREVFASQHFILGRDVSELEHDIAAYCGCDYGVGCASGSDALLLALMALAIGYGDEVITTPFTFFATAGSVARLGARPVFVDIDDGTFNIDPEQVGNAITDRTRALIPVHLFGQCADMKALNALARPRGIAVIEDAAQAIGAEYSSRRAGSFGSVAAFSFYPSKNLGGAGDGGMLTTNDGALAEKLRVLRTHGAREKYYHDFVGVNSRLDSLQAAILRVKLRYLDGWAEARRQNAKRYRRLFAQSGLVEQGQVRLPEETPGCLHVYNQFVIRVQRRNELKSFLREQGIGTEVYYPLALHEQPCFQYLGYREGDFPNAERAAREALAIPIYPEIGEDQQCYVVEAIGAYFRR
jgi:dTDP-4-amino-4,6-dideoxygalactose transaminase